MTSQLETRLQALEADAARAAEVQVTEVMSGQPESIWHAMVGGAGHGRMPSESGSGFVERMRGVARDAYAKYRKPVLMLLLSRTDAAV